MRSSHLAFPAVLLLVASASADPSFHWANPRPTGAELGGVDFESGTVGYAVGGFGATLRTTDGGVTWQDLTNPNVLGPDLDDVLVLSPGVLLAAGASPGLHRSTDGGLSWNPVANPAATHLRNLFQLNASTLFSVGDLGRVIRSTDGGGTWSLLASPAASNLVDQWWVSLATGYVVGPSCVRRTTDGGGSWAAIPNVNDSGVFLPGDIQFLDALNGWILLDFDTYRTTNGGATWAHLPMPFGQSPIYQEEALLLGTQTRLVATEGEGADIWKTTDDGLTWTRPFSHPGTRGVTDLLRLPGGAIIATSTDGDLLRSTDAGATWADFTQVAGPAVRADTNVLDIHASGLGFAGGYGSLWIQTTDSGRTWFTPATNPGLGEVYAITIRDALFALAGGSGTAGHSDVRRTTDGGATWTIHPLSGSYVGYAQGLAAFADGTCFCGTYGGTNINYVFRSTDDGDTWQLRNTGLSASDRVFDLFFLDAQHGFVCGGDFSAPKVYRTADGGGQWTPIGAGLLGSEIRDMHWFDETHGLVVGGNRIQRTTDGGGSWTTVSSSAGYEAIDFRDPLHGVADVFGNGAVLTSDGGATWTPVLLPLPGYISDVAMTPTGFLVSTGSNGILGYDTGEGAVVAPVIARASDAHDGLVAWPNPVRAGQTSELRFRLEGERASGPSPVEARLYDVAGRLVARAPLDAGARGGTLSLSAAGLRPGVMFLEVRGAHGEKLGAKIAVLR